MSKGIDKALEDTFVKIYMLTKLTKAEEKNFLAAITAPDVEPLEWVKPELVRWGSDADGTVHDDLLPLYKKRAAEEGKDARPFCFFADRQSVEEGGTIVAGRDWYTLCHSEEARRLMLERADEHGVELPGRDRRVLNGLERGLEGELVKRGVVWGREPGPAWMLDWANLDVVNMTLSEIVEFHGGEVQVLIEPEWDVEMFVKRLREEVEKMKGKGNQEK
ncbi:hypothetical protein CMUS01_04938 [Colletotrichum musicola]|uniref:Uncharacterized protein n=1 Tax=Colletotrichum musicola TaxID=2175873 RepID=A0A8H6KV14_9PEZI|nr:hypothetical protein CMUS01_04938 [Colletotrichum musicola]